MRIFSDCLSFLYLCLRAQVLEGLIPYTERHFQRLDKLLQRSYLIDYTLQRMNFVLGSGEMPELEKQLVRRKPEQDERIKRIEEAKKQQQEKSNNKKQHKQIANSKHDMMEEDGDEEEGQTIEQLLGIMKPPQARKVAPAALLPTLNEEQQREIDKENEGLSDEEAVDNDGMEIIVDTNSALKQANAKAEAVAKAASAPPQQQQKKGKKKMMGKKKPKQANKQSK